MLTGRDAGLAAVFEKERPNYVSHHAAQMDVRKSVADPLFDAEVNVLGSLRVLENASHFGVERIVYASTGGAVYGEPAYLPCDEAHPVAPLSPRTAPRRTRVPTATWISERWAYTLSTAPP